MSERYIAGACALSALLHTARKQAVRVLIVEGEYRKAVFVVENGMTLACVISTVMFSLYFSMGKKCEKS
jgi:hypothetical protein